MNLQGKPVLVVGLGESGLAMARWLHRQGARVRVADSRETPPNVAALQNAAPGAELVCGPFRPETFAGVDFIALSPGVPKATPAIAEAQAPLISEIDLFAWGIAQYLPESKVVAITGSNGKTTTTALTAHLLNSAGLHAVACGNISPSVLDALMAELDTPSSPLTPRSSPLIWVLELSSFQLETTHDLKPAGATVLNISEDHLDRYDGSLANYAAAKARIFKGNKATMILNRDDDYSLSMGRCGRNLVTFGLSRPGRAGDYGYADQALWLGNQRLIGLNELGLTGLHNAANAMAALALCASVGVPAAQVLPGLRQFKGLPHRVEFVLRHREVDYFDDSKGTNVGATLAAIEGLQRKVAIVLGGDGKGQDFSPLLPALQQHGRAVALIGRDAELIAQALAPCKLPMARCADMDAAVDFLAAQAQAGDCVLLSPACASLDMYRNYAHRADAFIQAARRISGGKP